jgi:hypothetical protein
VSVEAHAMRKQEAPARARTAIFIVPILVS